MAEEIDFENGRNSNFEGLVTLTLTFDPAIRHVVLQQSSTSSYIPNFIQIEETFCGRTDVRTDGRTDGRTDIFPLYTIRSTFGSRPKKVKINKKGTKTFYFTHMPRSPQWMDLYQIWFRGSSRGRNQLCGILLQSTHGFRFCDGSNFAISHWLGRSP